ncbi:hypothetical protein [Bergeyella zoohelcum]|uniref:Uncharacterized protein n=2 Tax=Bergeyella zoohelcum TaxID=1015 RepID=K1LJE6_9FLAO|nr:hypothetical protein [Bergeyella zoohelcum]EKB56855.1 hypothetical protein HMPREF9699_01258 [Bergeyella zoohelcum ATCC 43767]SUV48562.1 Uncharacterised protein [Bergeyella zoohelcum]VDH05802.1 Uncharacterised protein [Bergeyella zoohelcum]
MSKLLYDLLLLSVITKDDVASLVEKEGLHISNSDYYELIYPAKNKSFSDILFMFCRKNYQKDEIKIKYHLIIELFNRRKIIDIKEKLYYFFLDKRKDLLSIDFDFWNLVETDYELLQDGFEGIANSFKEIEYYLKKHSIYDEEDVSLISMIAK